MIPFCLWICQDTPYCGALGILVQLEFFGLYVPTVVT